MLLDKFGQDMRPGQPVRSLADWLTSAAVNSFDDLYPRDLCWSRPSDRDTSVPCALDFVDQLLIADGSKIG